MWSVRWARIALLNASARIPIEEVVLAIEKIETAVDPAFQEHFVNVMAFPNKVDEFAALQRVVELPAVKIILVDSLQGANHYRRRHR